MTTTLRISDELKAECDQVFDDIGINLSCAVTIFLKEVARSRSIPFPLRAGERVKMPRRVSLTDRILEKRRNHGYESAVCARLGLDAFAALREDSKDLEELSLDEINAEISAARNERINKKGE